MKLLFAIYYTDFYTIGDYMYNSYEEALDNVPDNGRYYIVVFQYENNEVIQC